MKGTTSELSQAQIKLRELERDATANRALYESFLGRFKETSQQEKLQTAGFTDHRAGFGAWRTKCAKQEPNRPDGGSCWVSVWGARWPTAEKLDSGFRSNDQIEAILGVPVLGVVPRAEGHAIDSRSFLQRLNIFAPLSRMFGGCKGRGRAQQAHGDCAAGSR